MKRQPPPISDEQLDTLLNNAQNIQPPEDFVSNIIQAIDVHTKAPPETIAQPHNTWWQLPAILLAAVPGAAQVITLIFSVWHVTAAG